MIPRRTGSHSKMWGNGIGLLPVSKKCYYLQFFKKPFYHGTVHFFLKANQFIFPWIGEFYIWTAHSSAVKAP